MELFRVGCVLCGRGREPLCRVCVRGLSTPPGTRVRGVGRITALFAYDGTGARVVQALKFRDGRRLVAPLADALVMASPPVAAAGHGPLVVSWVPTTAARRHRRGFDQSELLARALARRLGHPCRPLLRRAAGPAQTGRSRAERAHGVRFRTVDEPPSRVLLVDDVCTTGATLRSAVDAIRTLGAADVAACVVARTP